MHTTTRILSGLLAVIVVAAALPAWAQRVQFPTMVAQDSVYGAVPPATPAAPAPLAPPTLNPSMAPAPTTMPPAWDPYAAPSAQPYSPYTPSPYTPAPLPNTTGAEPLYPEGVSSPNMPSNWIESAQKPLKFLQEARMRADWLAPIGNDTNALGVTDFDLSATFAWPFMYNQSPLLITPGFGMHFWDGPVTIAPTNADLPPVTYDGFLDVGWQPQITRWLSANLGVRTGIYTDFHAVNNQSIRVMGRGLGVISLTPAFQVAMGVVYIDRNLVKILPAGGIIWTPNADARYEILFPNPKLTKRCRTVGNTDLWCYIAGEYGGGAWTIRRMSGASDNFDYNDIRVMLGIETFSQSGIHGNMEVGYVFNRQLVYRSGDPSRYDASDTIMLRAGIAR